MNWYLMHCIKCEWILTFYNRRLWILPWRRTVSDAYPRRRGYQRKYPWAPFPLEIGIGGSSLVFPRRPCSPLSARCSRLFSRTLSSLRSHFCTLPRGGSFLQRWAPRPARPLSSSPQPFLQTIPVNNIVDEFIEYYKIIFNMKLYEKL